MVKCIDYMDDVQETISFSWFVHLLFYQMTKCGSFLLIFTFKVGRPGSMQHIPPAEELIHGEHRSGAIPEKFLVVVTGGICWKIGKHGAVGI